MIVRGTVEKERSGKGLKGRQSEERGVKRGILEHSAGREVGEGGLRRGDTGLSPVGRAISKKR